MNKEEYIKKYNSIGLFTPSIGGATIIKLDTLFELLLEVKEELETKK